MKRTIQPFLLICIGLCFISLSACRLKLPQNSSTPLPDALVQPGKLPDPTIKRTIAGTIELGGYKRTYLLFVPPRAATRGALPVIFALHPWESTGREMLELSKFNQVADQKGAIVVYPDAWQGIWSDGRGATPTEAAGIDDVAFIQALLNKLAKDYTIDRDRVYAVGYSNGGHMAQLLACNLTDSLTAIAVVASSLQPRLASQCRPTRPISVIIIHGSEDEALPIEGIFTPEEEWRHLSTKEMVQTWAGLNGCSKPPVVTTLPAPINDGLSIDQISYQQCRGKAEVVFYDIQGGGHTWPGGMMPEEILGKTSRNLNATQVIYDFFLR